MSIYSVIDRLAETESRQMSLAGKWELRDSCYAYRFDTRAEAEAFAATSGILITEDNLRQLPRPNMADWM